MRAELVQMDCQRARQLACLIAIALMSISSVPLSSIDAENRNYSLVLRLDTKSGHLTPSELGLKIGRVRAQVSAVQQSPNIRRIVGIVTDASSRQTRVLSRERELAIAIVNSLSGVNTSFFITVAAIASRTERATPDRHVAIEHIREITCDAVNTAGVPIYEAIASTIRHMSTDRSIRILIFIGEGVYGDSKIRYEQLRNLAESNHVAFFAALVADHSLRGTKSILRYGWDLENLADDTAGRYLENENPLKAARVFSEDIDELSLVMFEMPIGQIGRLKVSVSLPSGNKFRAQKAIVIP